MRPPAIVILNAGALALARRIRQSVGGSIHAPGTVPDADRPFDTVAAHLRRLYQDGYPIIAIMAAGATIRCLAPVLADKTSEPPVICLSEDGATIVPILGGHRGGNTLAHALSALTGGYAAVTTVGDTRFGVALDAPPSGWTLQNPKAAKGVMAALIDGASVRTDRLPPFLADGDLPLSPEGSVRLTCDDALRDPAGLELLYRPRHLVLGMGAERGASAEEAIALAQATLAQAAVSPLSLALVATLDVKADEAALTAVADHFGVPLRVFDAARLEAERPRLENPSEIVFAEVGCHGVAEGAALAAAGAAGALLVPKRKSVRVTAALARAPQVLDPLAIGRARGRLTLVGIGPGSVEWRSPEATRAIEDADALVGYGLYLDLVRDVATRAERHDFPLGAEEDRVRHALTLAAEGREVALVCSGDAGIYAMATLAYELVDKGGLAPAEQRVDIRVCPGISALQAAAARAGAPLGHDFCTISLSDLLTPWPDIERRVAAAAMGDFVIAFYNPVSRRRRSQLAAARDMLLAHRPDDTPVVLATNLGRPGEAMRILPLSKLEVDMVDMLTVVVVGSSQSRAFQRGDGTWRVYTPRGYAGKAGRALDDVETVQSTEPAA